MEFFFYFLAPLIPIALIAHHLLRRLDAKQMGLSYSAYLICEHCGLTKEEWDRQKLMGDIMYDPRRNYSSGLFSISSDEEARG
ncbi:hypothetical protein C4587_01910 [Candidatus Parcubacteria bacterium]|nr:MAG: hypothetical protein C4587_01910 [Candidatus Parcubacteria bacterium]